MQRSLRVRLLLGAAIAILLALAGSWVGMTILFERHIERRVKEELVRDGKQLAASVSIGADGVPVIAREPGDARFEKPASGLYWQVSTPRGMLRSRSLWDQALPASGTASASRWSDRLVAGPFETELLLVERVVRPERGEADVLLQIGYESAPLHESRAQFGAELAVFLALLWVILSAAAWVQVELGLRPLRRVRSELEALQRDPRARLDAAHPLEIEPLIRAINELADTRERDLERARRRAADLAHGLKTPLAALSAQSRRAREAGAHAAADGLDRAINAATAAVEGELARSRAAAVRAASAGDSAAAQSLVESIIRVVERTESGQRLVFEVDVPEEMHVPVAAGDFTELMGALIENASHHARRRVRISGAASPDERQLCIDDDGPGIAPDQISEAMARGGRLDEAGTGHGLGLAIAHDLVEATRGRIELLRSDLGGLRVRISWAFTR